MSKRWLGKLLGIVLATALAATPLWADSQVRIVRLSLIDGPVQLDRGTGQGFERAIMNMPITTGMRLWTRDDSRAEVEFEDGTALRLTPGTKVDFSRLALTDDGKRSTVVTIESGEAYVNFRHKNGEDFRLRAGDREIDLSKPVQLRINVNDQRADIAVLGGELLADGNKIKKNHTAVLSFAGGGYEVAKGIAPGIDDQWNRERNDYLDTFVRSSYGGSGVYGVNDLNYFGSWFNSPFGSCWRPYGFSSGWSPYSSGAWVYYPNYGYSWVSMYPWGWIPYRSGAWNYAGGGLGWCWTPTRRYYGLGWAPVYHAPNGYVPPKPPPPAVTPGPVPPPAPRTYIGGGPPPRPRDGVILVGDVDEQTWRLRHDHGRQPWQGDRTPRGASFAGGSAATTPGTNAGATTSRPTATSQPADTHDRHIDAASVPETRNPHRDSNRSQWQQMQREQRQIQREQQRGFDHPNRGFERPNVAPRENAPSPHMSAPPPRTEAPRMSSPPPRAESPRMESPRMSAPRSEPSPHAPPKKD